MSDDSTTPATGPAVPATPVDGGPHPYPGAPAQSTPAYPGAPSYQPPAAYPPAQPYASTQAYPPAQPHASGHPYPTTQPYSVGQPYAAPLPTSGLAVAALITGIAGIVLSFAVFPLLASMAAIITGHMALKQTQPGSAIGGRGMAIAGLILGYVGVAILALIVIVSIFSLLFIGSIGFLPLLLS
ncbi:DUF4190 domain-containing protein [Microbacterium sp. AK031]|uniref:DUF4190 domain-containing protein n=1 Tax=Microbacterium sp. AK031 TaxID=2723076 RepID=UPI0021684616|nr:DUF4190 domain-containing protein [Microbacterium sp. AK031]MCS3842431.1 hypothetical protein [Microbacterium sp. AK031]